MKKSVLIPVCVTFVTIAVFSASIRAFGAPLKTKAPKLALDKASVQCMGCHKARKKENHPVGGDYRSISSARKGGYVAVSELNPAIVLVDGRVSCISCHIPFSKEFHVNTAERRRAEPAGPDIMLTVDNAASGLCTSCHIK